MKKLSQPVWQFKSDGIYIRRIESMSKAAKLVGSFTSNIKLACEVHNKVKGYYWRYAEGRHPLKIEVPPKRRGGKQVRVYKLNGRKRKNEPLLFNSIGEAARHANVSESTVRDICKNKRENYQNKFSFEFVNPDDKNNVLPDFDLYKRKFERKVPLNETPVMLTDLKTGKEYKFNSVNEAARKLKINDKGIRHVLAKRYKQTKGYTVKKI